jgi:PAS domain-containing protein
MSTLHVQFLDQGLHRVVFDAMPLPVFVVDQDVTIVEYNSAAARVMGAPKRRTINRRAGDVLHCLHSTEAPGGCGCSRFCSNCLVRKAVRASWKGKKVVRQRTTMELVSDGKPCKMEVKVSTTPFKFHTHVFILLVLEGLEASASRNPAT